MVGAHRRSRWSVVLSETPPENIHGLPTPSKMDPGAEIKPPGHV